MLEPPAPAAQASTMPHLHQDREDQRPQVQMPERAERRGDHRLLGLDGHREQ
jgi:hypothetical protein